MDAAAQFPLDKLGIVAGEPLGSGSFASVQSAQFKSTREAPDLAVKFINDDNKLARVHRETNCLRQLEQVVGSECLSCGFAATVPHSHIFISQLRATASIRYLLEDAGLFELVQIARQLLEQVALVQSAGIVHRDVKPANFLYDCDGRSGVLIDYGLAQPSIEVGSKQFREVCSVKKSRAPAPKKILHAGALSVPGRSDVGCRILSPIPASSLPSAKAERAGTAGFRPPEVLIASHEQSDKIDVWAIGVIIRSIAARHYPLIIERDDKFSLLELNALIDTSVLGSKEVSTYDIEAKFGIGSRVGYPKDLVKQQGSFKLAKMTFDSLCTPVHEGFFMRTLSEIDPAMVVQSPIVCAHLLDLVCLCMQQDPRQRPAARDLLQHPVFDLLD